jgi:curved DNA-binding protein CbpA
MTSNRRTYYEILGVGPTASPDEIHSAYRRLARQYHPDVNSGPDARTRFDELSSAYEVLHDPQQRSRYDRASFGVNRPATGLRQRAPRVVPTHPARDVPRFIDEDIDDQMHWAAAMPRWRLALVWATPRRLLDRDPAVPRWLW